MCLRRSSFRHLGLGVLETRGILPGYEVTGADFLGLL